MKETCPRRDDREIRLYHYGGLPSGVSKRVDGFQNVSSLKRLGQDMDIGMIERWPHTVGEQDESICWIEERLARPGVPSADFGIDDRAQCP